MVNMLTVYFVLLTSACKVVHSRTATVETTSHLNFSGLSAEYTHARTHPQYYVFRVITSGLIQTEFSSM